MKQSDWAESFRAFSEALRRTGVSMKDIQRRRKARRSITSEYAPAPFKNCVDI